MKMLYLPPDSFTPRCSLHLSSHRALEISHLPRLGKLLLAPITVVGSLRLETRVHGAAWARSLCKVGTHDIVGIAFLALEMKQNPEA